MTKIVWKKELYEYLLQTSDWHELIHPNNANEPSYIRSKEAMYELYSNSSKNGEKLVDFENFENPETVKIDASILENKLCVPLYVHRSSSDGLGSSYQLKYSTLVSTYDKYTLQEKFKKSSLNLKFGFPNLVLTTETSPKSIFLFDNLFCKKTFELKFDKNYDDFAGKNSENIRQDHKVEFIKSENNGGSIMILTKKLYLWVENKSLKMVKLFNPGNKKVLK